MDNRKFREQMEKLEKEREEFIKQLTPEGLKEYRQKEDEFNLKAKPGNSGAASNPKLQ